MNAILEKIKAIPGQLGARLPHIEINRVLLLPFGLLLVFALANVGLVAGLIFPGWESRTVLSAQVVQERDNLLSARRIREESPDSLQRRITQAQNTLGSAPKLFLGENQVNRIVSSIYDNAVLSGIALTDMSVQAGGPVTPTVAAGKGTPTSKAKTIATPAPSKTPTVANPATSVPAAGTTPGASGSATPKPRVVKPTPTVIVVETPSVPTLYRTTTLHLQAQGTSQRLVNFLARLQETGVPGVLVSSLTIVGKDELATLSMDLTLYSSSLVEKTAQTTGGLANATPRAVPTTIQPTPTESYPIVVTNAVSPVQAMATPTAQRLLVYTVQDGDTLYTVAGRFGASAQAMVNANAMTDLNLTKGQKLLIPVP